MSVIYSFGEVNTMAKDEIINFSAFEHPIQSRKFNAGAMVKRGGVLGVLGFATGWAVTQAITSNVMPNDPNKNTYDVMGGLVLGAALFGLAAAGVINITPVRAKL